MNQLHSNVVRANDDATDVVPDLAENWTASEDGKRSRVEVGGLPAQDWSLRVTLVYRREDAEWRLAHRHADPLVEGISLEQAAALARGEGT